MRIGIVGAGRIAQSLGRLLHTRGAAIAALASRNNESAQKAAAFIGPDVEPVPLGEMARHADHLIMAVTDDALGEVAEQLARLQFRGSAVLHTSGSAGLRVLQPLAFCGMALGVLHPLQTVPTPEAGLQSLPGSYFTIGGDTDALHWAKELVDLLQGHSLQVAPDTWPLYHAAAVMASNYQAALLDSALELFGQAGIAPDSALSALAPIVRSAVDTILSVGPAAALTGPIQRGDAGTVRTHVASLADCAPETRRLYIAAGLRTLSLAEQRGLPAAAASALRATLEGSSR